MNEVIPVEDDGGWDTTAFVPDVVPTGVITAGVPVTRDQAKAIERLLSNGADPRDLATLLGGTYKRVNVDSEDRSTKGRSL